MGIYRHFSPLAICFIAILVYVIFRLNPTHLTLAIAGTLGMIAALMVTVFTDSATKWTGNILVSMARTVKHSFVLRVFFRLSLLLALAGPLLRIAGVNWETQLRWLINISIILAVFIFFTACAYIRLRGMGELFRQLRRDEPFWR